MEEQLRILGQVAFAAFLGGVIGAEREYVGKAAGLRTHMLVAAAAALFLNLGTMIVTKFTAHSGGIVGVDPTRVIQAVVTGISFLGAGTIIFHRKRGSVEGLTTAASILLVAAVGMAVALGAFLLAVGVTLGALAILTGVGLLEGHFRKAHRRRSAGENPPDGQA